MRDRTATVLLSSATFLAASASLADPPRGRFVDVKPVAGIDVSGGEFAPFVSEDGLELYFDVTQGVDSDLWIATRPSPSSPFQNVSPIDAINSESDEDPGSLSADGLTLYFGSNRNGSFDMYRATRPDRQSPFADVTSLGTGVNTGISDNAPFVSLDGLTLFYHRSSGGGSPDHRLWTASRDSTAAAFGNAQDLGDAVNASPTADSWRPTVSSDGLTLFFSEGPFGPFRPGGIGGADIWVTRRESTSDPFGLPVNLGVLWPGSTINTPSFDGFAYISRDWPAAGSKLYFTTNRTGNWDTWEATWVPEPSALTMVALALLSGVVLQLFHFRKAASP